MAHFRASSLSATALLLFCSVAGVAGGASCSNGPADGGGPALGSGGTSLDGGIGGGGSASGATMGSGSAATTGGTGGGGAGSSTGAASGAGGLPSGGTSPAGGGAGAGGGPGPASGGSGGSAVGGSGGTVAALCDPSSAPPVARLGLETIVTSDKFQALIYAAQPPGSEDWYLVDILGKIWVYAGGQVLDTPFLDVSAEIQDLSFSYDERGLLSIAFAPDYPSSGKFYVAMVPTSTATANHDLVLEFARSQTDPMVADVSTRRAIIDFPPRGIDPSSGAQLDLNTIHNGSTVKFGPDGMLYFALGDGGGQCNSALPGEPQDVSSPFGKILRLDPNQPEPFAALGNPFATDGDPRVLHYGVRNPFRFSFDSATGDLYFGDVGQWSSEEISFAEAGSQGLNFGWPAFETIEENPQPDCETDVKLREGSTHTPPIHSIAHGTNSGAQALVMAVVGGAVYRGTALPALQGVYLFAEYYPGRPMGALYQCGNVTSDVVNIRKGCDANFPNDPCFLPQGGTSELGEVGAVVEGNDGELYLAANNNTLMKIVPVP